MIEIRFDILYAPSSIHQWFEWSTAKLSDNLSLGAIANKNIVCNQMEEARLFDQSRKHLPTS